MKNVLRPLTKLQHLHLGLFLSSTDLIYEHLNHVQEQIIFPGYDVESDGDEDEVGDADDDTTNTTGTVTEGELAITTAARERSAQAEAERNKPFGPKWCLLSALLPTLAVQNISRTIHKRSTPQALSSPSRPVTLLGSSPL